MRAHANVKTHRSPSSLSDTQSHTVPPLKKVLPPPQTGPSLQQHPACLRPPKSNKRLDRKASCHAHAMPNREGRQGDQAQPSPSPNPPPSSHPTSATFHPETQTAGPPRAVTTHSLFGALAPAARVHPPIHWRRRIVPCVPPKRKNRLPANHLTTTSIESPGLASAAGHHHPASAPPTVSPHRRLVRGIQDRDGGEEDDHQRETLPDPVRL